MGAKREMGGRAPLVSPLATALGVAFQKLLISGFCDMLWYAVSLPATQII